MDTPIQDLQVNIRQAGPIALEAQLSCAPGQLLALLGASGSGKTTILRMRSEPFSIRRDFLRLPHMV